MLRRLRLEPNSFSVLGIDISVTLIRRLALFSMVLSAAGAAWAIWMLLPAFRGNEVSRIKARYGPLLMDVASADIAKPDRVVEVGKFDDLARLANRDGRLILHSNGGSDHQFVVSEGDIAFRYVATNGANGKNGTGGQAAHDETRPPDAAAVGDEVRES